jgi:HK97 family phage major capsid protein
MKKMTVFALLFAALAALLVPFDTPAFYQSVLGALLVAAMPLLPRVNIDTSGGLLRCDDPAEMLAKAVKELGEGAAELRKQQDALKDAHREVMSAVEKGTKLAPDVQENIDKAIAKANEASTTVVELSQKMDDLKKTAENSSARPLTLRGEIRKNLAGENKDRYEQLLRGDSRSLRIVLKEITSTDVTTGMKREPYIDSLVSLERQPLRIRDLLTIVPVQTDAVKYGKQTLRDNKAKIVAHGTSKPYSNYKWEDATATIETIAHLAKMHLQALADAPRLAAEVESEMRYGYSMAEESEILNGDGTTGHLSGLIDNATAYAVPAGMDTSGILSPIDRLRVAMLQIHLAYAVPDGHVLNPINVAEIDLMRRDTDGNGGYLFSRPDGDTGVARIWRLPVVESPSMTVNEFLTGAFRYSAHLYDRQGITVAISTENDDDFETNKATMRVEGRIGLGVRRTYGLVTGSLKSGS